MSKTKYPIIVSPAGVAAYAWISKVDQGHKFSDGKYKVTLVLDKDDPALTVMKATVVAFGKEQFGDTNFKIPFKDGDSTGKDEFKGKMLVVAKSKFSPSCIDAKRNELPEDVWPFSGDLVKFSASLFPYETGGASGVSLQLRGVQLLDKRNMGGGGANDFGDEEGYDAFEDRGDGGTAEQRGGGGGEADAAKDF